MKSSSSILAAMAKRLRAAGEEPFTPMLEEYIMTRGKARKRLDNYVIDMTPRPRPPGRISPSKLCGCMRAAVFGFTGVRGEDKRDLDSELIFENGNWFHHKWQALTKDMELVLGRDRFRVLGIEEGIMIPELYIAGSLDIHLAIKVNERWMHYIVDIKSINSFGFNKVMEIQGPLPSHEQQVTAYAKGRRVRRGLLLYENKNDNRVMPFVFRVDEAVWREVVEWCEDTIDHLENETVPDMHPDCQTGTFLFDKCPYSRICTKKTNSQIQRLTYKNFPGVEVQWEILVRVS